MKNPHNVGLRKSLRTAVKGKIEPLTVEDMKEQGPAAITARGLHSRARTRKDMSLKIAIGEGILRWMLRPCTALHNSFHFLSSDASFPEKGLLSFLLDRSCCCLSDCRISFCNSHAEDCHKTAVGVGETWRRAEG